jgi:hypothetical protein
MQMEKEKMEKFQKLASQNRDEILNKDGFAREAKVVVEVLSLSPPERYMKPLKQVQIKASVGGESRMTGMRSGNNLTFEEKFEFPIQNREASLILEVINNSTTSGESKVPFQQITSQDEYEVDLEIADSENERQVWVLNIKLTLIWSYFKLYQDLYNKAEVAFNDNLAMLEKTNSVIENLTEPFRGVLKNDQTGGMGNDRIQLQENSETGSTVKPPHDIELQVGDKLESFLKSTFSNYFYFKIIENF